MRITRRTSVALVSAIAVSGASLLALPQANQAVVIKGRAPISTETLKVKLPRPAEADLANGLHLMVLEDHRLPQVTFQVLIPGAGGFFDPSETPGLAQITATMMREGTPTRNTTQIAETLETMAATVTSSTGLSSTSANVAGSSLTENFGATFDLAVDVLLHPTFPQEEFDRYKTRTRAGLIQQRSSSGFLASEMFQRVVFGTHPASRVTMTTEGLDKITRDAMVQYHASHFVPDHAVLAIAGDITMAEARKAAEAKLGAWKKAGATIPAIADPPTIGGPKVYFIARPNSVQTSLYLGTQGISRTSPDYDIVQVTNAILGGGPTGRLFTHLREEKGYTYGASSNVSALQYRGSWLAAMDVRSDVTEPALRDLIAEVTRMREEPVPQKEFDDRRRGMVANFALSLENPNAVLNNHITRWLYKLPADYFDKYPDRIMAVTQADVQAAAKKYLDPSRLQIVAVGDPKIGELLKQFGTVETYDTNGKRIGQ